MANYKVAYGKKENMSLAIELGIIPKGCIILTEDSNEIFFYDTDSVLKTYQERYKFDSLSDARKWVGTYDCKGQILSVHDQGRCELYVVQYDNNLTKLSGSSSSYQINSQNPTNLDYQYEILTHWINVVTEDVYILVSVKNNTASWKRITGGEGDGGSDASYIHTQSVASSTWVVHHNLNKYPSVTVVDSAGNVVTGDIKYIDINSIAIHFQSLFSGKAYVN